MTERFDVAILGAGLFGSALAYHLTRDGGQRVLALDASAAVPSLSGTATSAGVLTVQGWGPWDLRLVRESAQEYGQLAGAEGAEPVRTTGGLRVARTGAGVQWLERVRAVLLRAGYDARSVSGAEAETLLPSADLGDVQAGLYTPEDSVVSALALRNAYLRAAVRRGAVVEPSDPTASPLRSGPVGWSVPGPRDAVAKRLVVAAGASTKRLLAGLGVTLPLAPFRAQAVRLRPRPLLATFPTLHDLDLNLYLRPDSLGRVLAGDGTGTREEDPRHWDAAADLSFVESITRSVSALFGGSEPLAAEAAWAGLCVASPDRYPLVGRVPGLDRLYVASGFNGLGTMRAGALARLLAEALQSGRWEELRPADPGRFPGAVLPFDPHPEFPLEGDSPDDGAPGSDERTAPRAASAPDGATSTSRLLGALAEVDSLRWAPLSEWFDPFLPLFARDAIRTGGSVEVAEDGGAVVGLRLRSASEGVGSGFTRRRAVAEDYLRSMEPGGLYLEQAWGRAGESVEVLAADLRDWAPTGVRRNAIRLGRPSDLPAIAGLLRAELGSGVDPWIATLPRPEETAFVCEREGRIVGVSWLSRAGRSARGHSFVVHPRYRGLGIGTDLLEARMLWLRRTGGRSVVSEIYDGNVASRTAAERAGMATVGRMFHLRPDGGVPAARVRSAAPRTSGTPSRSSP